MSICTTIIFSKVLEYLLYLSKHRKFITILNEKVTYFTYTSDVTVNRVNLI